jgi:hypothetical protein
MKCPYVAFALLIVAACRTVDPPPPPAPRVGPSPVATQPVAATPPPSAAPSVPAPATPAPSPEAVSFEASVKPLLARTCTPCHVPGGRMYERMPFDRPEVVFSHKEGVLRRMKNPDDRQLLERWFAQEKS